MKQFLDAGPSPTTHLGRHLLAEFFDCNSNLLNHVTLIEQAMKEAALKCGATIVQSCFHHFSPFGVSGVVVIAESHLAIHTWPEHGYASVDLYTCGDQCDPEVAFDYLREKFLAGHANYVALHRGFLDNETQQVRKLAPLTVGQRHVGLTGEGEAASFVEATRLENAGDVLVSDFGAADESAEKVAL